MPLTEATRKIENLLGKKGGRVCRMGGREPKKRQVEEEEEEGDIE
jgi:hypothetical protein